ncbi:MAG TPA: hypothetical protein VN915_17680 [Elusimicrobiota bacterium]|nr:hypothetical protein [Elusimicrobiota bacterium]
MRTALLLLLAAAASGCAATKTWWYGQTGRMTASEASAHGHPECADLTLRQCQAKVQAQKEAARPAP